MHEEGYNTNLSNLSDEQLDALIAAKRKQPEPASISALSNEQLDALIEAKRKESPTTFIREVGRTGRALATGVASIADIPNLAALGLHMVGLKETPTFYKPFAQSTQETIDELTGGALKPRNKTERYVDAIVEGFTPIGGASLLAKAGKTGQVSSASKTGKALAPTKANVASNVGSSAGIQNYLEDNEDPGIVGMLASGLAGGSLGLAAANPRLALQVAKDAGKSVKDAGKSVKDTGAYLTAKAIGFSPEKYKEGLRTGLPLSVADVSTRPSMAANEAVLSRAPGAVSPFEKFYKERHDAILKNLGIDTSSDVDKFPSIHLAKKGASQHKKNVSEEYERLKAPFAQREQEAINQQRPINLSDVQEELNKKTAHLTAQEKEFFKENPYTKTQKELDKATNLPRNKELQKTRDKIENQVRTQLGEAPSSVIDKALNDALEGIPLSQEGTMSYGGFNQYRKNILDKAKTLDPSSNEYRELMDVYAILREKKNTDIRSFATPAEVNAEKSARDFYANYSSEHKTNMKKYVEDLVSPAKTEQQAFDMLTRDEKYMRAAREGLSTVAEQSELGKTIMEQAGKRQGQFNINTWHTQFNGWKPGVKREYLKFMAPSEKKLFQRTMNNIGKNKDKYEKYANKSGTAMHAQHYSTIANIVGAAASVASGNVAPLAATVASLMSTKGAAKLWTNQDFLKRMNGVMEAKGRLSQASKLEDLLKLPVVRKFMKKEK